MKKYIPALLVIIGLVLFTSCKNEVRTDSGNTSDTDNKILQQEDGTISLKLEKAECYHDMDNPKSNTAEWSILVSKSGRFDVWLSSATTDTTNLKYENSVMLSFLENRLEKRPLCDKVFQNSTDVTFPYFRADSFMGSLYIQDTGLYNIQIISEKIVPTNYRGNDTATFNSSKLLSVFLTPAIH